MTLYTRTAPQPARNATSRPRGSGAGAVLRKASPRAVAILGILRAGIPVPKDRLLRPLVTS